MTASGVPPAKERSHSPPRFGEHLSHIAVLLIVSYCYVQPRRQLIPLRVTPDGREYGLATQCHSLCIMSLWAYIAFECFVSTYILTVSGHTSAERDSATLLLDNEVELL